MILKLLFPKHSSADRLRPPDRGTSDTIARILAIRRRHDFYNRLLTVLLVLPVCAVGGAFWLAGIPLEERYKTTTGLAIMFLAFVFYKIPYFSYRLNCRRFAGDEDSLRLMGNGWRQYKSRILNQPLY